MKRARPSIRWLLLAALGLTAGPGPAPAVLAQAAGGKAVHPEVSRLRNIGKAYFENGVTLARALEVFKNAAALSPSTAEERVNLGLALLRLNRIEDAKAELERAASLDSALVHPHYALGLVAKRQSDFQRAAREFGEALRLDPTDGTTAFQLGLAYKELGEQAKAEQAFRRAAQLDASHSGAHFQLYQLLLQRGTKPEADAELKIFNDLKRSATLSRADQDAERSRYAEPIASTPARTPAGSAVTPIHFSPVEPTGDLSAVPPLRAVRAVDVDLDGLPELLTVAGGEDAALQLFRRTASAAWEAGTVEAGLSGAKAPAGLAAGDLLNHRVPDLWLPGPAGGLWRAEARAGQPPRYARRDGDRPPAVAPVHRAVLVDYDHDNDLDLLVVGTTATLERNNGDGTFTDVTRQLDSQGPPAGAVDAAAIDLDNLAVSDLVLLGRDGTLTLYRDRKAGRFERVDLTVGQPGLREASRLLVEDLDNDGMPDLIVAADVGLVLLQNQGAGRFRELVRSPATLGLPGAPRVLASADLDNDGFADLVVADPSRARAVVLRNRGGLTFAPAAEMAAAGEAAAPFESLEIVDLDGDGAPDVVGLTADGRLALFRSDGGSPNRWLRVALTGVKGVRSGVGARVEVRAGAQYVRRQAERPLVQLGLGAATEIDAVRITWPNGFIQNELDVTPNTTLNVREAERVAGSCPTIFAWNGERFVFVTDAFISGPMGVPLAPGRYFPVDHDEYVLIPGTALTPADGRLLVQFTEELREVVYLDRTRLWAVDHPAGVEVVPNEWFGPPPFPSFGLHTIVDGRPPRRATEDSGADVSPLVEKVDGRWPHGFRQRTDYPGLAELHTLTLDLGDLRGARRIVLYLTGWFYYFEASTLVALGQQSAVPFIPPRLQVRDAGGNWVTVLESMGMPPGKGKTIPVDMTGKFLADDFHVRIVTNLAVYWDRVLVDTSDEPAPTVTTEASLSGADVHFRGFSRPIVHPERLAPERFDYERVILEAPWGQVQGLYTRYGDVRDLLAEPDDRYVIFGAGDEVSFAFEASALPPLRPGWTRDYLLYLEGWVKDGDPNTAFGSSVEPLPFHAMSGYPYGAGERFPDGPAQREWMAVYNTRPAVRLWPSL